MKVNIIVGIYFLLNDNRPTFYQFCLCFFYVALIKIIEFFILDYLPNTTYKTYAEITCFVELLALK